MEKPEHYSTEPPRKMTDRELAETWQWASKLYDMGDDTPQEPMERLRQTQRLDELENELMSRGLRPAEDDDGLLFAVVTEDGERIA